MIALIFKKLVSMRSLELMMKRLVFKSLPIINKCKVLFLIKIIKKNKFPKQHPSKIFNNHDQKDDFAVGYDQSIEEQVVVLKHHATVITYQEDIVFDDGINDIVVSNFCQELALQEEHQQFKEGVFGCSLKLEFFQDDDSKVVDGLEIISDISNSF
jgi:hypothetical protein